MQRDAAPDHINVMQRAAAAAVHDLRAWPALTLDPDVLPAHRHHHFALRQRKGNRHLYLGEAELTGSLVTVRAVNGDEDAMIVTDKGIIIRIALDHVGVYGRNTQGVKLINVADDETVTKVAVVARNEEEQSEE